MLWFTLHEPKEEERGDSQRYGHNNIDPPVTRQSYRAAAPTFEIEIENSHAK
jgi:hypothetical protein